jgi:hypothetical protein
MAIRRPVVSVPEGGNPTLGLEQMPTGDTVDPATLPAPVIPAHDTTGPTGTGPEFEHYNAAERAVVDAEVAASALHRVDTANPHAVTALQAGAEPANANIQAHVAGPVGGNPHGVTAAQAGAAPIAHVGAGGVAEHPVFSNGVEGFVPDPGAGSGLFLRDDGVWATPPGVGFTLVWRFETSTVMAAPASNRFRMNNATPASVTAFAFDDQTRDGVDASTILDNLESGDAILIQQKNDATKYIVCDVTLSTDNTGWFQVDVTVADSGVIFDNNQDCIVVIVKGTGGGGGSFALAALQARKDNAVAIGTAWADVLLNNTDIENEAATVEHNNTNTDDIDFKVAGLYKVTYTVNITHTGASNTNLLLQGRMRLNDSTVIAGSFQETSIFDDNSIEDGESEFVLPQIFIFSAAASDKITLQLQYVDISGTGTPGMDTDEIVITVEQLFRP